MSEIRAPTFVAVCQSGRWTPIIHPKMHVLTLSELTTKLVAHYASQVLERGVSLEIGKKRPPFPSNECFIEFVGDHKPILEAGGHPLAVRGYGILSKTKYVAFTCDLEANEEVVVRGDWMIERGASGSTMQSRATARHPEQRGPELEALFDAICYVLASRRTVSRSVRSKEEALSKHETATPPTISYRCIDVNLDAIGDEEAAVLTMSRLTGRIGTALHEVRGHKRTLASGKEVWVSPHKRGDPRYGVRLRDHNVMRNEEMQ